MNCKTCNHYNACLNLLNHPKEIADAVLESRFKNGCRYFEECIADINKTLKWISLADRLPETGQIVLLNTVVNKAYKSVKVAVFDGERFYNYSQGRQFSNYRDITHWMPLPEPYKIRERDKE